MSNYRILVFVCMLVIYLIFMLVCFTTNYQKKHKRIVLVTARRNARVGLFGGWLVSYINIQTKISLNPPKKLWQKILCS